MKKLLAFAAWALAAPALALPQAVCDFAKEMTPLIAEELGSNPTMMAEAGLVSASDVGAAQFDCSKGARSFRVKDPEAAAAASTIRGAIEPTDFYHVPFCTGDRCPLVGTFEVGPRGVELASFGEALFAEALETGRTRVKSASGDLEVVSVPYAALDMLVEGESLLPLNGGGELPDRLGLEELREIARKVEEEAALDQGAEMETMDELPLDVEPLEGDDQSRDSQSDDGASILPTLPNPPGGGKGEGRILPLTPVPAKTAPYSPAAQDRQSKPLLGPSSGESPHVKLALGGLIVSLLGGLGIVLFLRFRPGAF